MTLAATDRGDDKPNVVDIGNDYNKEQGESLGKPTLFEVNFTNIVGLAILGAVGWAGLQISDNNVAVEKQGVLVNGLSTEVQSMRATITSQGTAQQLLRNDLDHALVRLEKVERQQENMENEVMGYLVSDIKQQQPYKGN